MVVCLFNLRYARCLQPVDERHLSQQKQHIEKLVKKHMKQKKFRHINKKTEDEIILKFDTLF